jgi:Putative glucoamylase/Protein of unknown function (DUF3131)
VPLLALLCTLVLAAGCSRTPLFAWLPFGDDRCAFQEMVGGRVEPAATSVVVPRAKKAWEASLGGEEAAKPYIRARLAGWPSRALVERSELPRDDAAFVARLARDTWRGLDAFIDREHHLPVDHVRFGATVARDAARVGDYTNITSVGLQLLAIVAAHELALIDDAAATERIGAMLDTLDRLETYDGFFFNYYDTTSLERTSNLISFVDSSWLTAGLMVVRSAFPALSARCTRLIDRQHYRFFYDDTLRLMSHGYWVQLGARSRYHYGVLYAESRLGSLIAIGKGDVPEAHWFAMARTFPSACGWQPQAPHGRHRKSVRGYPVVGGWYEWKGVRYVPSWGGSMFEALMPTLVVDERRYAAANLGANGVAHAGVQARWAVDALGYSVWGMSPSATPGTDGYGEYGVRVLGSLGYPGGAVTPHAAALALTVTPAAAVADLRALAERYDLYGDFGFYDAVDPQSGAVARAYLALDQAMILIAAANHLTDGAVQRRFAADPIATRALALVADENFFD